MRNRKIVIAGGGTGGHIFPAVAIANALKRQAPDTEILFIGAKGKMEMEKVPEAGFNIEGLDIMGFNRSSLIKNLSLPIKLVKSFFQVRKIGRQFLVDIKTMLVSKSHESRSSGNHFCHRCQIIEIGD